ncbi:MAG: hypothetical protein QOH12_2460 [Solirubrobacteraceae bacterium]|nr:hypothetical protein [Solirubrobacteraceae bacterium]
MSNFLEEKRSEIAERMRELEPLIEEYKQLEAALKALAGVRSVPAPTPRVRVARGRPSPNGSTGHSASAKRRGRPRGSGTRARQALELVGSRPGITIPEMASEMGIKQNYLYRVLPTLAEDGKVVKRDRGWHALTASSAE